MSAVEDGIIRFGVPVDAKGSGVAASEAAGFRARLRRLVVRATEIDAEWLDLILSPRSHFIEERIFLEQELCFLVYLTYISWSSCTDGYQRISPHSSLHFVYITNGLRPILATSRIATVDISFSARSRTDSSSLSIYI